RFMGSRSAGRVSAVVCAIILASAFPHAQTAHSLGGDRTGVPLPGCRINGYRGAQIIQTITTGADGTFDLNPGEPNDMVEAALEGFETMKGPRVASNRIVLPIGRANEVTEVVASALTSSGSTMEHLGSTMSAPLAQRLPT